MAACPFDALAADYDRDFTQSLIGRRMRRAVWRRMDARFQSGDRILELNCGTGEDALHLGQQGIHVLATDLSRAMLEITSRKIQAAALSHRVTVFPMAIEELAGILANSDTHPSFDGALSNFGGLNCVTDLRAVSQGLAACLRPGATAVLCLMGRFCPWEWGWYLRRGELRKAFRRLSGCTRWRGLQIRYPSIASVRRAFAPAFRFLRVSAIGALLPPTYTESWAARHPDLLAELDLWERRLERLPPFPWLADHYLVELERV